MSVTKSTPAKITLYTAPAWKKDMLRLAVEVASGGKLDMGALMKPAMGVSVENFSADEAGEDPKGKSKQAEPGRPAV